MKKGELVIQENEELQKKESTFLMLDTTKIELSLGFFPLLELNQGIQWTMDWYKEFIEKPHNVKEFSKKQCKNYINLRNESI